MITDTNPIYSHSTRDNINEVMTWLEQQTDNEHLHLPIWPTLSNMF
jgi:hypothetical protein